MAPGRQLSSRVTLRMRASAVSMLPVRRGTWTTGTVALAASSLLSDGFGRADASVVGVACAKTVSTDWEESVKFARLGNSPGCLA